AVGGKVFGSGFEYRSLVAKMNAGERIRLGSAHRANPEHEVPEENESAKDGRQACRDAFCGGIWDGLFQKRNRLLQIILTMAPEEKNDRSDGDGREHGREKNDCDRGARLREVPFRLINDRQEEVRW